MSTKYRLHCNCQKQDNNNYSHKGINRIMMVSVIQVAKQNIQKDSDDSPCYGPLKTADQMLNPGNKFVPVGLVILKQFKIGK